ncbi:outer membrane protein OmpX [Rouxiella sp. T17]|uniref:outer membrane protein OmpX n=1 Tax=Rouxiella sp. T17 TaxID=3085684 RepID=UPI002FC898BF
MKKIACLSALACVVALSTSSAFAGTSTVTGGYAQGDAQGVLNKVKGFNLKYRYEFDDTPWGVIGSATYLEKSDSYGDTYKKGTYYGVTAGPAFRINDWASIYGVVGVSVAEWDTIQNAQSTTDRRRNEPTDAGFTYGAGLQFNPIENVALDFSYEQSRIRNTDVGTWIAGVGYRF